MEFLRIDKTKCKKDGICIKECPGNLIRFQEDTGYPGIFPNGDRACNRCGHCVAVCHHGALTHSAIPVEDCPSIKPELSLNEEQAIQFVRSRRSIRDYKDKPVEKEKIKRLIEIACYAPTGGNGQLLEWLVLTDKTRMKKIAGLAVDSIRRNIKENPQALELQPYLPMVVKAWEAGYDIILRNAPVLVVASAPKEAPDGMVDLSLALSYLDLMAPTVGLGTCWAGLLQHALVSSPSLKESLGVPVEHPYLYPMMLGYPKAKYYRLPGRKLPKIIFR